MTETDVQQGVPANASEEQPEASPYAFVPAEDGGTPPALVTNPGTPLEKTTQPTDSPVQQESSSAATDDPLLNEDPAFTTKKFVLQAMLEKAGSVVPNRDVLAVLKNFLVEVSPDQLRVAATDLELAIVVTQHLVSTQRPGTIVLPAQRMLEIVKEAAEGELKVDVKDGEAHISVGHAEWHIKLQPADDYPQLPEIDQVELTPVDRVDFLSALSTVRHAASREATRASLMMIDITDGKMRAADGVRFQQRLVPGTPSMQIPVNAVGDLIKILRTTEAPKLGIGEDDSSVIFRVGDDDFVAQKPTAVFPDVDKMLLKPALTNDQVFSVDREELMAAIKRVRITADPDTSAVVLTLTPSKLTVTSKDKNGSRASETLDASWSSPDRTLSFNHAHLHELLGSLDTASVVAKLGEDTKTRPSPLLITDEESGSIAVLNQLRLDWIG